jgi:hypothetical protein
MCRQEQYSNPLYNFATSPLGAQRKCQHGSLPAAIGGIPETVNGGAIAGVADLHAIMTDHLKDIMTRIVSANNDIYKRFWNENSHAES